MIHTFTIANGATESDVHDLEGHSIIKIEFPTMTGTSLTIQEADAGETYRTVGDASGWAFSAVRQRLISKARHWRGISWRPMLQSGKTRPNSWR